MHTTERLPAPQGTSSPLYLAAMSVSEPSIIGVRQLSRDERTRIDRLWTLSIDVPAHTAPLAGAHMWSDFGTMEVAFATQGDLAKLTLRGTLEDLARFAEWSDRYLGSHVVQALEPKAQGALLANGQTQVLKEGTPMTPAQLDAVTHRWTIAFPVDNPMPVMTASLLWTRFGGMEVHGGVNQDGNYCAVVTGNARQLQRYIQWADQNFKVGLARHFAGQPFVEGRGPGAAPQRGVA